MLLKVIPNRKFEGFRKAENPQQLVKGPSQRSHDTEADDIVENVRIRKESY